MRTATAAINAGAPAEEEMGKECQHCYGEDRGDEDLRNAVETLYWCLGRLCRCWFHLSETD